MDPTAPSASVRSSMTWCTITNQNTSVRSAPGWPNGPGCPKKLFFGLILDCSPLVWCCCVIGHTYMVSMTFVWLCCMYAKAIVVFNYHCNLLTFLNRGYVRSFGLSKKKVVTVVVVYTRRRELSARLPLRVVPRISFALMCTLQYIATITLFR